LQYDGILLRWALVSEGDFIDPPMLASMYGPTDEKIENKLISLFIPQTPLHFASLIYLMDTIYDKGRNKGKIENSIKYLIDIGGFIKKIDRYQLNPFHISVFLSDKHKNNSLKEIFQKSNSTFKEIDLDVELKKNVLLEKIDYLNLPDLKLKFLETKEKINEKSNIDLNNQVLKSTPNILVNELKEKIVEKSNINQNNQVMISTPKLLDQVIDNKNESKKRKSSEITGENLSNQPNRDRITCVCGANIFKSGLAIHFSSTKHKTFIKKKNI
jgi:hypothetical protein